MPKQTCRHANERQHKVKTEQVCFDAQWIGATDEEHVVNSDRDGYDERLPRLDAVNPSEDVDAMSTKYGNQGHVDVVEQA